MLTDDQCVRLLQEMHRVANIYPNHPLYEQIMDLAIYVNEMQRENDG